MQFVIDDFRDYDSYKKATEAVKSALPVSGSPIQEKEDIVEEPDPPTPVKPEITSLNQFEPQIFEPEPRYNVAFFLVCFVFPISAQYREVSKTIIFRVELKKFLA